MSSLWQIPKFLFFYLFIYLFFFFFCFFFFFFFQMIITEDSASYFIEMFMLISLECTLAQTRMEFGRATLPRKGPMRDQYVFLVAKSQIL